MELLWIDYVKRNGVHRYILFLLLGKKIGKLCGLDANNVPDNLKIKIANSLSNLSLESRIKWLKKNCPTLLNDSYKELVESRARICNIYNIGVK